MRIVALGDTHGRVLWKEIVAKEKDADKIVFIGDYFDTHYDISVDQQIQNFKEILEFKKNNMDQVVLLLGNHDFHYLNEAQEKYSGFQAFKYVDINEILQPAVKSGLVQMCFKARSNQHQSEFEFLLYANRKTYFRFRNPTFVPKRRSVVQRQFAVPTV